MCRGKRRARSQRRRSERNSFITEDIQKLESTSAIYLELNKENHLSIHIHA